MTDADRAPEALTDPELEAMLERCERAMPGPWRAVHDPGAGWELWTHGTERPRPMFFAIDAETGAETAPFLAAARTDVPRLVRELQAARARITLLEQRLTREREETERLRRICPANHGTCASPAR